MSSMSFMVVLSLGRKNKGEREEGEGREGQVTCHRLHA